MASGLKRGRPKTATVLEEIYNNKENHHDSNSTQEKMGWKKCEICHRDFPRRKSLKQHMKVHTGVKPYACTYPGCKREFTQSGHLKLHTILHTKEKPFACPVPGCTSRFPHSNRKCHKHRDKKLIRDGLQRISYPADPTVAEILWFKDYEAKLAQSFKRQRNASASPTSRDSFDLIVSTSSDMGRLVIDEKDLIVPSVAKPCNFIWNKENLPSASTTPQSLASGYSAASPESGSTSPQSSSSYYPSTPPKSGSTTPQSLSTDNSSTSPQFGSTTPQSLSKYYPSTPPPESGATTPQRSSSASLGREYNSASDDNSQFILNRCSPKERAAVMTLVNLGEHHAKFIFSQQAEMENWCYR